MTGAELKTLREALGLTVQELSALVGVRARSLNYWESGRTPVPEDVAETVAQIDRRFDEVAAFAVAKAQDEAADVVVLRRFRDVAKLHDAHPEISYGGLFHHAALLERSRRRLVQAGFSVEIVYA